HPLVPPSRFRPKTSPSHGDWSSNCTSPCADLAIPAVRHLAAASTAPRMALDGIAGVCFECSLFEFGGLVHNLHEQPNAEPKGHVEVRSTRQVRTSERNLLRSKQADFREDHPHKPENHDVPSGRRPRPQPQKQ